MLSSDRGHQERKATPRRGARALVRAALIVGLAIGASACEVNNPRSAKDLLARKSFPALTPLYADVSFGELSTQTLDLYAPPAKKHGGVIVWLHGGGWTGGSKSEISPIAQSLVQERGWTLLSVNYRTADQSPFPAALDDTKLAIRWAKAEGPKHGLDPKRVIVMGWSAGGHLAALAATSSGDLEPTDIPSNLLGVTSRPAAAVALSSPLDPATFARTGTWDLAANRRSTSRLLGCTDDVTIDSCPTRGSTVAPATWADPTDAPVYIAAGDADPIVELQSQAIAPAAEMTTRMGDNKVWLDVVDTGDVTARAHSVDYAMNRWALEQFLKWAPRL